MPSYYSWRTRRWLCLCVDLANDLAVTRFSWMLHREAEAIHQVNREPFMGWNITEGLWCRRTDYESIPTCSCTERGFHANDLNMWEISNPTWSVCSVLLTEINLLKGEPSTHPWNSSAGMRRSKRWTVTMYIFFFSRISSHLNTQSKQKNVCVCVCTHCKL